MVCGKHCVVLAVTLRGRWMNLQICRLNPVALRYHFKWTSTVWIQQVECVCVCFPLPPPQNTVTWDMTLCSLVDLCTTCTDPWLEVSMHWNSRVFPLLGCTVFSVPVWCHGIHGTFVSFSGSFLIWFLWQLWMWQQSFGKSSFHIVDEWKTNLMPLAILFHLLCAQHVSDINISIFRSLRLCWWITTSVVLFSVRCVLEHLLQLVFGGVRFAGFIRKLKQLM